MELERRFYTVNPEVRAANEGGKKMMRGHAALFDSLSQDLGGFRERIAPGAFARTVLEQDVRALFNHDPNFVLGRNTAGTLKLSEDSRGLAIEIDPPDTQVARDLMVLMERGDVNQMSFGFYTRSDRWDKVDGEWIRTLLDVELLDVSPVTYPAYTQTDIGLRTAVDGLNKAKQQEVTPPADHAVANEIRRLKLRLVELGA